MTQAKRVAKPWGEERWLVPEGSPFGFKMIVVRKGNRTSLQYHEEKEEANLVLRGEGRLIFAETPNAPRAAYPLAPGDIVRVVPGQVHRIEATADIVLIEVSTPELDDVIRLEDDTGRKHGRIQQEHHD
ncbi:sugar isomerase [Amycolatopsis orientalis]|uniref:Sugar isomerase n=1 Tax=Amycolatopsis orientalis TaxID=31958 RepID=A0A193CC85_AMYOR|nr:sugar isomerase [Amycolatopsis orientalis]